MENVIKGKKVYFSNFEAEDYLTLTKNQWDNEFLRMVSWDTFHPWNEEDWEKFAGDPDDHSRFLFALKEIEQVAFIGWVSLSDVQFKNRGAEVSIAILNEKDRNKGYGTDAVYLISKFAFYELGLHKLRLTVNSNNPKAIKVYEKIGFKREGTDREALYQDGKWIDIYHYGLLFKEFTGLQDI